MSDLESQTKPLLKSVVQGEQVMLKTAQQQELGTWAVKIAMVEDGRKTKALPRSYTFAETQAFRESKAIPEHTHVWLGRSSRVAVALTTSGIRMSAGGTWNEGMITTIVLGHCVFQVFSLHLLDAGPGPHFDVLVPKGEWDQLLIPIWPRQDAVAWPPELDFTNDDGASSLTKLRQRFHFGAEV